MELLQKAGADPVTTAATKTHYDEIVAPLDEDEVNPRMIVTRGSVAAAFVQADPKAGQSFEVPAKQYGQAPTTQDG
ncbi:hypothetical protein [Burkholderia sp. BCC0405]|uniref:hypothetical protein n=1 Tax=Burkholderia sp. BCC0405 TaxID=2676298 RepID=UPI00158B5F31|nr:hypothetical protein [Burkholderia sp. BCC0405]